MVVLSTGVGKTALACWIATDYLARGERVVWLAHRTELVSQPLDTLKRFFPEYAKRAGIVQAAVNKPNADIVFASKDTLLNANRLNEILSYGKPALIVVDEAHHSPGRSWRTVIEGLQHDGARLLGLTATPERTDSLDLSDLWEIVYSFGVLDAIRGGILRQPYAATVDIPELDLSAVGGRRDYNDNELWAALAKAHIVEHTVAAIGDKHVSYSLPFRDTRNTMEVGTRSTIVFTATVEQAQLTAEALKAAGKTACHVSGKTPPRDRARLLGAFARGEIQFVCNAAVLTEGTDLPKASCIVLARPTKSWSLFVQCVGRALRNPWDIGDALILDLAAGATKLHSLVAAPVLISGGCQESPDGRHAWLEADSGEGVCQFCHEVIPCARRGGPHAFKEGSCKTCGKTQCGASPDKQHHWIPWDEGKRACVHCAMEIADTITSLIGQKKREPYREPAAWQKLEVPGEVWAVHLGKIGVVFRVRRTGGWEPFWWDTKGRPKSLSGRAVPSSESDLLTNDVFRKVEKVRGLAGGKPSTSAYRRAYTEAERVARTHSLWK